MTKHTVGKIERFPAYFMVSLKPASDSQNFDFLPGQYATISFKADGRWSPERCFSMTSSPDDGELRFATRRTGRFTNKLAGLKPGTPVRVQGPYGSFNIDTDFDKRIVMLAGGIGITPFMSMLRWATKIKLSIPITLVYACRSTDDIPFQDEIRQLQRRNPHLQVVFVVADGPADKSRGVFRRRIDEDLLSQVTNNQLEDLTFFVCGPQGFTQTIKEMLHSQGVDDSRLVVESFTQTTHLGWGVKLSIPSLTYATTGLALLAGIGFFMTIDLSRYLPKAEAKAVPSSSSITSAPATNTDTTTNDTGANNPAPTPSSSSQVYQAPVTSVS